MCRLTDHRKTEAREVLDRYNQQLHDTRKICRSDLELKLRDIWGLGYQNLKGIMIDILSNHPEYEHLAAYYMDVDYDGITGVVMEFQQPLAKLYGLTSWHDEEKKAKRTAYWKDAFR